MMYAGTGYSQQQQPAFLGPGGVQQQQPALLGPGGIQQQQPALLGPGGVQQQQPALLGPGGTQQILGPGGTQQLLGPGGTQRLLGPGGMQFQTGAGVGCCGVGGVAGGAGGCTSTEYGGALSYVGAGGGEYIQETTYKYVGQGAGDLSFATPRRSMVLPCIVALLALLAVAVLVFVMVPPLNSTTRKGSSSFGTCTFWGDPHVVTFDGGRPSFYGEGEFWIVKHPDVKIQGRYSGTKYTLGLASTRRVAVSGNVINGHKIEVEPLEADFGGEIRIDGQPVLRDFGTIGVGGATVTYDGDGELVDEATSRWAKKVVHIRVPSKGIHMEVFRWGNYIDMRLRMPPLEGMDGSCGNFNGYASDDTTAAIFERVGARVALGENLFTRREPVEFSKQMEGMLNSHCDDNTKDLATQKCTEELLQDASSKQMKACMFDRCFGMDEHALLTAKTFASEKELEDARLD